MEFGEILERWEKARQPREEQPGEEQPSQAGRRVDMGAALERYPPAAGTRDERRADDPGRESPPRAPRDLPPQAELDLHGLTAPQAEEAIDAFVRDARARGFTKVLLIHGKGNHSPGEPVLERVVRNFLEKCPHTGAFGKAARAQGGRGATWVRIRQG
jgi:DNA-nicking Smr family endonuclease